MSAFCAFRPKTGAGVKGHWGSRRRTLKLGQAASRDPVSDAARQLWAPGLITPGYAQRHASSAKAPSIFASIGVGANCEAIRLASVRC
jgi:hypothetical protein